MAVEKYSIYRYIQCIVFNKTYRIVCACCSVCRNVGTQLYYIVIIINKSCVVLPRFSVTKYAACETKNANHSGINTRR